MLTPGEILSEVLAPCGQNEIGTKKNSYQFRAAELPEPGLIGNVGDKVLGPSAEDWPRATVRQSESPPAYKVRLSGVTKQEF